MLIKDYAPVRELPVVPLRGLVVFPESRVHFEITRQSSILALKAAMREDQEIFFVMQKDILSEEPGIEQLHSLGDQIFRNGEARQRHRCHQRAKNHHNAQDSVQHIVYESVFFDDDFLAKIIQSYTPLRPIRPSHGGHVPPTEPP